MLPLSAVRTRPVDFVQIIDAQSAIDIHPARADAIKILQDMCQAACTLPEGFYLHEIKNQTFIKQSGEAKIFKAELVTKDGSQQVVLRKILLHSDDTEFVRLLCIMVDYFTLTTLSSDYATHTTRDHFSQAASAQKHPATARRIL